MGGLFDRLSSELAAREKAAGLSMADVLTLPEELRKLVNWMIRQEEVGLEEVAVFLQKDEPAAGRILETLIEKGFVRELEVSGKFRYRVRLASKRKRQVPLNIWQIIDEKTDQQESE